MNNRTLLIGGGLIALFFFAKSKIGKVVEGISISRVRVRVESFQVFSLRLTLKLTLDIRNSNPVPIPFNSFFGELLYGDVPLTPIQVYNGSDLAPRSVTPVDVLSEINLTQFGGNIITIVQSGQLLRDLRLKGKLNLRQGVALNVDEPLTVI